MGIPAQLADCPPNRPKSREEHKGRCVTFCGALSGGPRHQGPPPGVFYSAPVRRTGGVRLFSPARRAGEGWKTISSPGPEGQDGERLFWDTSPSWPSIGPMVSFRALWLHSGLRLAYGSVPAPFWPMVSFWALTFRGVWSFTAVRYAQNKDAPPGAYRGRHLSSANLINRGLLIRLQKRKIISEENLIVRWS